MVVALSGKRSPLTLVRGEAIEAPRPRSWSKAVIAWQTDFSYAPACFPSRLRMRTRGFIRRLLQLIRRTLPLLSIAEIMERNWHIA